MLNHKEHPLYQSLTRDTFESLILCWLAYFEVICLRKNHDLVEIVHEKNPMHVQLRVKLCLSTIESIKRRKNQIGL
jgi:hypothetical protein